jgi:hypothetical protein
MEMSRDSEQSIFARYYGAEPFVDRFQRQPEQAVDVIIPIIHTNEFWRANLLSIYREIPVNRLILGDGGCIDGSIDVAREFPRVEVLNHRDFVSLGYSLRHLIEATSTEWFVYLHSDVYLPDGWFDCMSAQRGNFDWFECSQRITVLADYMLEMADAKRAFSGSQMGRKAAFANVTPQIDDDYLYRNEDIIIADLLKREGFRYGRVGDAYHFHQVMHKPSRWRRRIKNVEIHLDLGKDEDIRASDTYVRGIVKYLDPEQTPQEVIDSLRYPIGRLINLKALNADQFRAWVGETNPKWLPYFRNIGSSPYRDWIADRVIVAAKLYRDMGLRSTLGFVLRRAAAEFRGRLSSR